MKKQRNITNQNLDIEILERTIYSNIAVYYTAEEKEKQLLL